MLSSVTKLKAKGLSFERDTARIGCDLTDVVRRLDRMEKTLNMSQLLSARARDGMRI